MRKIIIMVSFLLLPISSVFAGSVTLNTYYPAPFGAYDRLRLVPRGAALACTAALEGLMYYDDALNAIVLCQEDTLGNFLFGPISGVWTQDSNDNVFLTDTVTNPNLKVGIGTTTPSETLDIGGSVNLTDVIKINTTTVFSIKGNQNIFVGENAGIVNTGIQNTFLGNQAGANNINGSVNTAVGQNALASNTSGSTNVALGVDALAANTTANSNTAIGRRAMLSNTTGVLNVAVGYSAMMNTIDGDTNTAVGTNAMIGNISGSKNVAVGKIALSGNGSGNRNTAVGYGAGNITGSDNVFIGHQAGNAELGSNKLYIANSAINPPLIFGDFSTGRIGLGTTNPLERLHIGGSGKMQFGDSILNPGGKLRVNLADGETENQAIKTMVTRTTGINYGVNGTATGVGADRNVGLYGWAKNAATNWGLWINEGDAIIQKGNVGIGTTAPTQSLDINGAMKLEPTAAAPTCFPTGAGILWVSSSNTLCFCNGIDWTLLAGNGNCT